MSTSTDIFNEYAHVQRRILLRTIYIYIYISLQPYFIGMSYETVTDYDQRFSKEEGEEERQGEEEGG